MPTRMRTRNGVYGVASASTSVSNSGVIITLGNSSSPGILATAYAIAGNIATGNATAVTAVSNSGVVATSGSDFRWHPCGV